jgi:hypothetical protein
MDLESWNPFFGTVGFLVLSILSIRTVSPRPRQSETVELGSRAIQR